jgi:hypothetical protein
MARKTSGATNILRFTIKPVGTSRSEEQVRQDVKAALDEALNNYNAQSKKAVKAEAEPEGAFTGIELAVFWLLKTFAGGVVGGVGATAGKKLYGLFSTSLKKRNLDPGPPTTVKSKERIKSDKKRS